MRWFDMIRYDDDDDDDDEVFFSDMIYGLGVMVC